MPVAPTVKLNDGTEMPIIGLGTAHPRVFDSDPTAVHALEIGYRHFDTAWLYGNQSVLGDALRKGIKQLGIKREDIFVTSKVWNNFHKKESTIKNCQTNLDQLKFDYVDLLLVHSPVSFQEDPDNPFPCDADGKHLYSDVDVLETWQGMEECLKKGMTKSIGVSNFGIQGLKRILDNCTVKPTVNQVECHPYLNRKELVDFCKSHDIIVTTYGPLGSPYNQAAFVTTEPIDRNLHILEDPVVVEIANNHKKTPAQVSLRWAVQRGAVPLPRSNKKHRLEENFGIFDFELTSDEMQKIDGLNKSAHAYPSHKFKDHPQYINHVDFT